MRILAVFIVAVFFGFGTVLVAQPPGGGQRGGGPQGGMQFQGAPMQAQPGGGPPQRMQGGMQPGGQQPQWGGAQAPGGRGQPGTQDNQPMRPAQPGQPPQARPMPPNAQGPPSAQGNQPARPAQPGAMNPNQVTQAIARLRTMDANQNGVLEASEIPATQRDRVNTIVTQLGGNPNGTSFNLANLERRAMTAAGGAQPNQPNQQQADNSRQQQRQQPVTPLVLPFGERVTAEAPPVMFGQRVPDGQMTAQTRGAGGQQRGAAANQRQSAVPAPTIVKVSTPYDNVSAALRNNQEFRWFFDADTDQDGQLTMQEFVAAFGGVWTKELAGEFAGYGRVLDRNGTEYMDIGLDRNGDGFATMDEALITVKDKTERHAQEEAIAQEAAPASRPQGRQPPPAAAQNARAPSGNNTMNQTRQPPTSANNQGNAQQGRQQGNPQDNRQQMGRGGGQSGNFRGGRGG